LQSFELQERDAYLSFVKSTQELQMYLWKENQEFYEISKLIFPSSILMSIPDIPIMNFWCRI
jgi:hypothetical protein